MRMDDEKSEEGKKEDCPEDSREGREKGKKRRKRREEKGRRSRRREKIERFHRNPTNSIRCPHRLLDSSSSLDKKSSRYFYIHKRETKEKGYS